MSLVLDLIFPKKCILCGRGQSYFCQSCLNQQVRHSIKHLSKIPYCEGFLPLFKYNSLIKKGIAELKYKFVTDLVEELSDIFVKEIKTNFPQLLNYWQKNNFIFIPIPLHYYRQNWRGFNQSFLLAKSISQKLNLGYDQNIIIRSKNTIPQAKLSSRSLRHSNISSAFTCLTTQIPQNIILFDDVSTSQSTFKSAQNSLKLGEQNRCWFLSLAG